jgi:hypothetical protein
MPLRCRVWVGPLCGALPIADCLAQGKGGLRWGRRHKDVRMDSSTLLTQNRSSRDIERVALSSPAGDRAASRGRSSAHQANGSHPLARAAQVGLPLPAAP